MRNIYKSLLELFRASESMEYFSKPLSFVITLIIILVIAWLSFYITRKVALGIASRLAARTKSQWDDITIKHKVLKWLSHLIPAFIFYYTYNFASPQLLKPLDELSDATLQQLSVDYYLYIGPFLLKAIKLYFTIIVVTILNTLLNAGNEIYNTSSLAFHRSIKGYIQLIKLLILFLGGIMVVSILINQDPSRLIAGLGAMAAILLLVFKDTILGFVASIQLSANDMVKIGDWIAMPGHKADGTVLDITLNTVKVQNWDMTITTIPTYALVAESFNNWKGMEESDGRRIKRSINIDMKSIKFCTNEMLHRFEKFSLVKDYVVGKEEELKNYNREKQLLEEDTISRRHQTNIGIFRKYLETYLRSHPMINLKMTFLVRHLQPTEKGLPIEIYVFSKDQRYHYEAIQADIFDHLLAVLPEFELRVFQNPTGEDFHNLISKA